MAYSQVPTRTGSDPNASADINQLQSNFNVFSGIIFPFGGTATPSGFLLCDGSAVNRTTYADLFAAIGTTWGVGNGSTTFNVPDLRGVFLRGTGSNGTLNMADGNDFAGPAVGASENDQLQGFKMDTAESGGLHRNDVAAAAGASEGVRTNAGANKIYIDTFVNDGTNGTPRTGDETRPVNSGITYVIKT